MLVKEDGLYGHAISIGHPARGRGLFNRQMNSRISLSDGSSLFEHDLDASSSVTDELGINANERSVSLSGLLLDTESVLLLGLVVSGMVL